MARSNTGGTRGFLRGRVAADLYQVTKDVSGKRIQLVRSVEDSRINNNTMEQALARMRMALLMGALSDMKSIVDHSFEGIPYGQLSIAHFVKLNMPRVIQDQYENWASESNFLYPDKGISQMRIGNFRVATGSLPTPTAIEHIWPTDRLGTAKFRINIGKPNPTMADLKQALGLAVDDYITLLVQGAFYSSQTGLTNCGFFYVRLYVNGAISDDTAITAANASDMFTYEGNTPHSIQFNQAAGMFYAYVDIEPDDNAREEFYHAIIVSKWNGRVWQRNNVEFVNYDGGTNVGYDDAAANWHFQSWYLTWDPDGEDAGEYPGKPPY